ncbi:HupE/UreJ family protein [Aequorivita sp. F47161]|uniref:HupE/UreJ family protein n=1 Tax=Aequorivita vitellina TaxID=2874475 RepID=A0A9X1U8P3_9FLAO|nr:HupE/UreJ family protein [Aequorivita vitellina]MCG2417651.1 HupE/UreJ family protein [Aequorivita vitellina]MCZ4317870.1 HupE/UreJ family protein [Aequorivita viscosa]
MTDFWLYFNLGLHHVLDWKAYDHILFLIVLCAAYNFSSWKKLLILVTMFTIGHTLSLLLAAYNVVSVSGKLIEFLIPVTILTTALFNLFTAGKEKKVEKMGILYIATIFFGIIHGLGFASFFTALDSGRDFLPLLEFALGIEAAQIIVVIIILIIAFIFQTIFRFNKRDWVLVVSSLVIGMVIPMLMNNWIF